MEDNGEMINTRIQIQRDGIVQEGRIVNQKRDAQGMLIGTRHANPILDLHECEVEFPDGSYSSYAANTLMENLYSQVDDHGRTEARLQGIIDHRVCNDAIDKKMLGSHYRLVQRNE